MIASPLVALHFLTRLRIPGSRDGTMDDASRSQVWFAAVGLLIGACASGADWLASRAMPPSTSAAIAVVVLVAVTGALHLDGLGDTADGLLGGSARERRLAIMRDPHAGSFAIVAIASVLLLKYAALASLSDGDRWAALLVTPTAARCGMVAVAAAFPYARTDGMGASFRAGAWPLGIAACAATALPVGGYLFGFAGLGVVAAAIVSALAVGAYARRLIGGVTGDVYGAAIEIAEAGALLCVVAFAGRGWL